MMQLLMIKYISFQRSPVTKKDFPIDVPSDKKKFTAAVTGHTQS
jgi:hypothetical protein